MATTILRACVGLVCFMLPRHPAHADTLFRLTEVVSEQEVRPRSAKHETRWQGDYYVADQGVFVSGWAVKHASNLISYDQPHKGTNMAGSAYTSIFHRLPNGVDVQIEYDSFIVERHVVQTGPKTCTDHVSTWLKPGHTLFEVHRTSNHEPMFDTTRAYAITKCEFPPLTS